MSEPTGMIESKIAYLENLFNYPIRANLASIGRI